MTLLIIFLPLLGFLSSILLSRYIGRNGSAFITTGLMFVNIILTFVLFYKVCILERLCFIKIGT
jgi:NADH:ubiquinone oxidoreductase subunit 5 (subunit L)/multisubunit Na+/H+ antiporter MnhA subunit